MINRPSGDASEQLKNKIHSLNNQLDFTPQTLHQLGHEILPAVQEAANLLDHAMPPYSAQTLKLIRHVSYYYLFHARDRELSLRFLQKQEKQYQANTLQYARLLAYTAYAYTIDGGYKEDKIYQDALGILQNLPDTTSLQAFCYRYIALITHRKSFNDQLSPLEKKAFSENAKSIITKAIKIYEDLKDLQQSWGLGPRAILLDLAESTHILGVIEAGMGNLEEAKLKLQAAEQYSKDFCKTTDTDLNHGHPIMFITQQSLGDILTRLGNPEQGLKHLDLALAGHQRWNGTEMHPDIGKTFHFRGNAFTHQQDHKTALENYTSAMRIKREKKSSPFMQKLGQMAMLNSLARLPAFDWNDYKTIKPYQGNDKKNIAAIEAALDELSNCAGIQILQLNQNQELQQLARHYFQLGTYHNHITKDGEKAEKYLSMAKNIFTCLNNFGNEFSWIENHLAFSHQQQLLFYKTRLENKDIQDIEEKPENDTSYIYQYTRHYTLATQSCYATNLFYAASREAEDVKINAFALCVRALTQYESRQIDDAIANYQAAIKLYELIGQRDDQYARAKNRYACMLTEKKNFAEAEKTFAELETYWSKNQDNNNPYPARFYDSYARFLLAQNKPDLALQKFQRAHAILSVTDGPEADYTKDILAKIEGLRKSSKTAMPKQTITPGVQFYQLQKPVTGDGRQADTSREYKR